MVHALPLKLRKGNGGACNLRSIVHDSKFDLIFNFCIYVYFLNLPAEDEDEEEDGDEGDLIVAAEGLESVDPAVLSTLPPSMQLDIMTKLREQKTYVNREGFQQRQAQPLSFSQFQMEEYLKASAIRCALHSIVEEPVIISQPFLQKKGI